MLTILLSLLWSASAKIGERPVPTPNDYKVNGFDNNFGINDEMYAGFMPVKHHENNEGSFFFWLAKRRQVLRNGERDKLVIWLNGGPGCSSMVGMMFENGPFTIHLDNSTDGLKRYSLLNNQYSWNNVANVLFVEQPIRTGFSVAADGARIIQTEQDVAEDFRSFMLSFMEVFNEFKGVDMYLSGESYAGFYIPWMAAEIVKNQIVTVSQVHNGRETHTKIRDSNVDGINLVGAAIGNGVLDYFIQEPSYAEYAYYHGLIPLGAKNKFDHDVQLCFSKIRAQDVEPTVGSYESCAILDQVKEAAGQPNEYDTSTFVLYDRIIQKGSAFDQFFQDPDIQRMIHVRGYNLPGINFIPETPVTAAGAPTVTPTTSNHNDVKDEQHDKRHVKQQAEIVDIEANSNTISHSDHRNNKRSHLVHDEEKVEMIHYNHGVPSISRTMKKSNSHKSHHRTLQDSNNSNYYNTDNLGYYYEPASGWTVCNDLIDTQMGADHPTSAVSIIQYLIDNDFHVMLYSGEQDLNCNTLGTLHTLEAYTWRNKPWSYASRSLWRYNGDVAGEYFHIDNVFSFLIVRNSGHLLPMDLPATSLDLLNRFIHNITFADTILPSEFTYEMTSIDEGSSNSNNNVMLNNNGSTSRSSFDLVMAEFLFTMLVIIGIVAWMKRKQLRNYYYGNNYSNSTHNNEDDEEVAIMNGNKGMFVNHYPPSSGNSVIEFKDIKYQSIN